MIRWVSAQAFQERLTPALWLQVTGTFLVVLLPLLFFLPLPLTIALCGGLACKYVAVRIQNDKPGLIVAAGIAIFGVVLLYGYRRSLGLSFIFVAFLALTGMCKLLESRNRRDIQVLFLIEMLLLLAALTYAQTLWVFVCNLVGLVLALRMLWLLGQQNRLKPATLRLREIGKVLLLALPFTLLLFFLIPRIQPLWGVAKPQQSAVTGLPDEMSMGDLSSLAQSNEVAFRVTFSQDKIPPGRDLYWRGPVLWHFDGQYWRQRRSDLFTPPAGVRYQKDSVLSYDLQPAKADLKWLTPLDLPVQWPENVKVGAAFQMLRPLRAAPGTRYHFISATRYQNSRGLSAQDKRDALQLPESLLMPQLQAFSRRLYRENHGDSEAFAKAFLAYLTQHDYYYSLEPPPGAGNPEIFFFRDRIGFCEHYAGTMALAARSVGIPARVVIGYQGGSLNPLSGDWVVREEAAHAWTELWIKDKGWVRFDPTAAVSPNRILQGRLSAESLTAGKDNRALSSRIADNVGAVAWLRNAADATRGFWQRWVIDLNRERQQGLLKRLGIAHYSAGISIIVVLVLSFLLAVFFYRFLLRRMSRHDDAVTRMLQKKIRRLEAQGYIKASAESSADYFRRIAGEMPPQKGQYLLQAAGHYEALRYRETENASQLLSLLKRI